MNLFISNGFQLQHQHFDGHQDIHDHYPEALINHYTGSTSMLSSSVQAQGGARDFDDL